MALHLPGLPQGGAVQASQSPIANLIKNPFLLNILAQQGFSTTPGPGPLGVLGRAGLATQQQEQQQGTRDLQNRLLEATIGLRKAQAGGGGPNIGAVDPSKFTPESLAEFQRTGNFSSLKQAGPGGQDLNKIVNELADDVRSESKEFSQQSQAFQRIKASAIDPSPAGDLALIFGFMKVLDPGSTVREGEFANAQNSGSVPTRVRQVYNQVIEGTRLTGPQRRDFVNRASRLFNSAVGVQQKKNERFRSRGRNAGLTDEFINPVLPLAELVDLPEFDPSEVAGDDDDRAALQSRLDAALAELKDAGVTLNAE